ncbi:MAG: hypothetical protein AAFV88_21790, partial [Planctomycetota bacterium]
MMSYRSPNRLRLKTLLGALLALLAAGGGIGNVTAQSNSLANSADGIATDSSDATPKGSGELRIGIGGHYRVGCLTSIRLKTGDRFTDPNDLLVETVDGDGVRVQFSPYAGMNFTPNDWSEITYIAPGSEAAPIVIRSKEAGVLLESRFPLAGNPAEGPAMIPASTPWVLAIGDPLGVDRIGTSNVLTEKLARIAVTKIEDSGRLPQHVWGYDGVDLIMINQAGIDVVRQLSADQRAALTLWLKRGGRVLLCLGESTSEFQDAAPWLLQWLPLEEIQVTRYDPAAFETYTASQTPLKRFEGIRLPRKTGRSILMGRTSRRVSAVLAGSYVYGLGRCTVITADLDSELFAEWPERLSLVTQVMGDFFDEKDERLKRDGSIAFNDIAGQMRGALDQFPIKPTFSFSLLSLLLMILIAILGPLDYLLINRVLGRPLLGWLSFPLFAITLSVFLISQAKPNKVDRSGENKNASEGPLANMRANQFQIVDLDLVSGAGRGLAWSYVYAHEPAQVKAHWQLNDQMRSLQSEDSELTQVAYPMGYPGKSFGGIQLAGENQSLGAYQVDSVPSEPGIGSEISDLTIAPRSSRSIACEVNLAVKPIANEQGLIRRPGSELLRGEFTNPLPVDLLDGQIVFGNWVYLLPTRVPAGATLPSLGDLRQKNFRWKLTRQQSFEKNVTESVPWKTGD